MTIHAAYERGTDAGITGAAGRAVAGIKRAMASISEAGGITLPTWFLGVVTAAFLAGTASVIGVAWSTSQTVAEDHTMVLDNKARIARLEDMKADVVALKEDMAAVRENTARTDQNVDWMIKRELNKSGAHE